MRAMVPLAALAAGAAGAVVAAVIFVSGPVVAEDDMRVGPVKDTTVLKECGACHMPYPAGLLPARSWTAIMADLANHFGENAELDPDTTRRIAAYLTANASDGRRPRTAAKGSAVPMRITEMPWWQGEHRGRVTATALKRRGATSKSDCVACHAGAARGFFDDD